MDPEDEQAKTAKTQTLITAHLESIVSASFTALNTQNFNTSTTPWTHFSKSFRNEPNGPAPNLSTYDSYPELSNTSATNLQNMLAFFETLYTTCPEYQTLIVDMTTTELDLEKGEGSVLVNAVSEGIPAGVKRPSVSVFEFRRSGREWLCVRQRTLPGIEYIPEG